MVAVLPPDGKAPVTVCSRVEMSEVTVYSEKSPHETAGALLQEENDMKVARDGQRQMKKARLGHLKAHNELLLMDLEDVLVSRVWTDEDDGENDAVDVAFISSEKKLTCQFSL
jgi:hypothetical protein